MEATILVYSKVYTLGKPDIYPVTCTVIIFVYFELVLPTRIVDTCKLSTHIKNNVAKIRQCHYLIRKGWVHFLRYQVHYCSIYTKIILNKINFQSLFMFKEGQMTFSVDRTDEP